jgi:hypothetical protein
LSPVAGAGSPSCFSGCSLLAGGSGMSSEILAVLRPNRKRDLSGKGRVLVARSLARNWLPRRGLALSEGSGRLVCQIQQSSLSRQPNREPQPRKCPAFPRRQKHFFRCRPLKRSQFRRTGGPPGADRSSWTRLPRVAALTAARAATSGLFAGVPTQTSLLPAHSNNESGLSSL